MATTALARRSESTSVTSRPETREAADSPDNTLNNDQRARPTESRMNRIARRAHAIYEARGGEHGHALDDWLQAEREIDSEIEDERGREGLPQNRDAR
jgi:hypothetical protein